MADGASDELDPQAFAIQRADETLTPLSTLIEITHACNVDCEHCYLDLVPDKKIGALSADEWKRILGQIKAQGGLFLTISGGEILVRRDWFEIASHARKLGFALRLFTNGTMVDDDAADKMASLKPLAVEISLLGGIAATHDAIARRKGAFDRTIAGVKRLRERRVKVLLKCVVMERNARELPMLEAIASELGCDFQIDTILTPKNNGSFSPQDLATNEDLLLAAQKRIIERSADAPQSEKSGCGFSRGDKLTEHPCAAGRRTCHVGPAGDLFPCTQWTSPVGNLRDTSFKDLWERSEVFEKIRAKTVADFPVCARCELLEICNPCMALSALEVGAILGPSRSKCNWAESRAKALDKPGRSAWLAMTDEERAQAVRASTAGRVRLPLLTAS